LTRKQTEQQVIQDCQETFATEHGQRALERIAKYCKEDESCYKSGKSDNDILVDIGKRCVILMLRRQLKRDLNVVKQKEARNDRDS